MVLTATGKICTRCERDLPLSEFSKHRGCKLGLRPQCRTCVRLMRPPPGEQRERALVGLYGITSAEYDAMLVRQDGLCAICASPSSRAGERRMYVDHDHSTGLVRALLCANCNTGLGMFADDPDRLLAAATYLLQRADLLTPKETSP